MHEPQVVDQNTSRIGFSVNCPASLNCWPLTAVKVTPSKEEMLSFLSSGMKKYIRKQLRTASIIKTL